MGNQEGKSPFLDRYGISCRCGDLLVTAAYVPDRGDLVWLESTPQVGSEHAGMRPALVISPRAYNAKVGFALFCPVTSRVKGYPFEVALPNGSGVVGVVLADQLKSLDWSARKAKLIERASVDVLAMVTARILPLLVPDNAATQGQRYAKPSSGGLRFLLA
ncbi:MAG: endoribonuclease MazF [Bacteroidetes bacterium]|nr:endoribonuclease MazF [Bacteroidota bacterium]